MSLIRAGILLFISMLVLGFGFNWLASSLARAGAPDIVVLLFGLLAVGSSFAAYGGVVLSVSGWAIRSKDNWMSQGLRLLLWGVGPFLLLQVLSAVLQGIGLGGGAIALILLVFVLVTITMALSGIFLIVADIFRTIDRRNTRI